MVSGLVLSGVCKAFGSAIVLAGVDLAVPAGSVTAVLGPSGGGKTTLLRIVAGFERPDAGSVTVDGRTVASPGVSLPPERRRVGIVPQEGALFPHLSVAGNVGYGLHRHQRGGRVAEVLALVGLAGYGRRMPHELSGGEQQRVAVARALAPRPSLVLLDEPFSALDAGLRTEVRSDIRAALSADGATAVLVTHDQAEALSMADLVAVLRDGRVMQAGPPTQVYREPVDLGVATFVGEALILPCEVTGGMADTILGRLPARGTAPTGPATVVVRPEQLAVARSGPGAPGRVAGLTFYGHDALLRVRLDSGGEVAARILQGDPAVTEGETVFLSVRGPVSVYPPGASCERPATDAHVS